MRVPGTDRGLAFLDGPGEVAALIRVRSWADAAIGEPATWPTSLRTVLRTVLASRFAMWLAWGPELTFFCNDAYRPTLGAKKDWLGAPARDVWPEIWPDIGPEIAGVLAGGGATWHDALPLFLDRNGFVEETYHTGSYSPLFDDDGATVGMLCVVTESTSRVLSDRRMAFLGDLSTRIAAARTEREVWGALGTSLAGGHRDVPLVAAYRYDGEGRPHLAMATGCRDAEPTRRFDWPLGAIDAGADALVVDDRTGLRSSAWHRPCHEALLVPIGATRGEQPLGVLVAGINPFRPLDDDYRRFLGLVARQIATGLAVTDALAAEHRRAEALAEIDRAKTAFFSNVSHEFRTPLTLMLGPLEDALAAGVESPAQRERLVVAHRNGLRLLRHVNALLDFARMEAGRTDARFRPTDLAALTTDLASSFRAAIERAGLELRVSASPLREPVFVDPDLWEKIVFNLLSNAFKFTFAGRIDVTVADADDRVRLVVADTGTGIPEAALPHLFERFYRVDGPHGRSFEGSGIGLALVADMVGLHGGAVAVDSTVGVGTTLTIEIPFGSAHLPAERIEAARDGGRGAAVNGRAFVEEASRWIPGVGPAALDDAVRPPVAPATADAARLLVVDDNRDLRDYLARLLSSAGYAVSVANDGLEALQRVRTARPDALVCDVMMPRLDGFALVDAIRRDPTSRDLPVLLLSARAGESARIEGWTSGADDYLTKPFSARELLARVAAVLTTARVRREAGEAREAADRRLVAVLDAIGGGLVLVDASFRVLQANRAARGRDGAPMSAMVGRSWWDAWPDDPREATARLLRQTMADRTARIVGRVRMARVGPVTTVELRAGPVGDGLAIFQRAVGAATLASPGASATNAPARRPRSV